VVGVTGFEPATYTSRMDLSDIGQSKLNAIARRLNERPRETLSFETPAERFAQCVASIS
jgi:IS30 family transposase